MVQINIKMPKSCFECPIKQVKTAMNGEFYYRCELVHDILDGPKRFEERMEGCPLKEIKEVKE